MDPKLDPQKMSKMSTTGSKREPKWSQNGVQKHVKKRSRIETKTGSLFDAKKEVSEYHFH